jgi:hypothetical protein
MSESVKDENPTVDLSPRVFLAATEEASSAGLLQAFFHVVGCLQINVDYSGSRAPDSAELEALYNVSPVCARLVTEYSEMQTRISRDQVEVKP